MDVSQIVTEFGDYYEGSNSTNMSRLVKKLDFSNETDSIMTQMRTDDTVYRASESRIDDILQGYQKAWTPLGEVEFVPIEIFAKHFKVDFEEYPNDLEATWLGFLASNSLSYKEWPFIRWLLEVHLIPKMSENWELKEVYKGVYAAPTPGTATTPGTNIDGLRKVINDQVTAGRISPIVTGAPETDPVSFVEQIEDFIDSIDVLYRNRNMDLCMSQDLERRFVRGYEAKYGVKFIQIGGDANPIRPKFSNMTIVGLPSMAGDNKWFATPKSNLIQIRKKSINMNRFMLEQVDRKLKVFTDFWKGLGFLIPEIVFTNDQELT